MERIQEITSIILNTISEQKKDLSIGDLAALTGIHRNVLAKYIKVLEAQGKIEILHVGVKKYIQLSHRLSISLLKTITSHPFLIFDRNNSLIGHSDTFLELLQLKNQSQTDLNFQIIINEIFLTNDVIHLLGLAVLGKNSEYDLETIVNDSSRYFLLKIIPIVLESGRPGSALIIEDNTVHVLEKKEYERFRKIYQKLIDNQIQFIVQIDIELRIISANSNFLNHTGIDEKSLLGSSFIPIFPKDDCDDIILKFSSISKENPDSFIEMRRMNIRGDFSWERWKIIGIPDEFTKQIIEYTAIGIDITELKRTQEEFNHLKNNLETLIQSRTVELREINREFQKEIIQRAAIEKELSLMKFAMDNAHDFIFLFDNSGEIHYMNNPVKALYTNVNKSPIYLHDIISAHSKYGPSLGILNPEEMINSGMNTLKCGINRGDGKQIPVEITISRIIERGETIYCGIARDITDRSKVESDLFQYRKHLEEIIDERTKRLQKEVDAKKSLEQSLHFCQTKVHFFSDTHYSSVFIYDIENRQYIEMNRTAGILFSIKEDEIEHSIPHALSLFKLSNNQSLLEFINEKMDDLMNDKPRLFNQSFLTSPFEGKEMTIVFEMIKSESHSYVRIDIIDLSFLHSS